VSGWSEENSLVFRALLDVTPELIVLLDPGGRIVMFNKACETLTGYRCDEVIGRNPLDFLVPENWIDAVQKRFSDPFAPEVAHPHNHPWLTKSGEERLILWRCAALGLADNKPPFILDIGTDVTEQALIGEEFRKQQWLMEVFFDSILNCAALLDRNFNFIRVNRAYAMACQRDPAEFPGRNHFDLYPSDAKAIFEEVVKTRRPYTAMARPFRFPDQPDRVTYWDWTLVPVLDRQSEVELLLFCLNDVTEKHNAGESLRRATEQLRVLSTELVDVQESERRRVARILHDEIGQELTAVKLTIENRIAASHGGADVRLRGALDGVNEILGRVRQISLDLRPPVLDDLGLIPALVWLINRQRTLSGLDVSFRHHGLDRRLSPDVETAVYRIVQEALTNVVRHAGVLRAILSVWASDRTLIFSVTDDGSGFNTDTAMNAGDGGGLTGMRERVRALGGRVTFETMPGSGTAVIAELPISHHAVTAME
jgi:PAS domain S-box-containing protein